jgi:hypothetical protein
MIDAHDNASAYTTVGLTHFRPSQEINKYGDGSVPGYVDVIVVIDTSFALYKKGTTWHIRLVEQSVADEMRRNNHANYILVDLASNESVHTAFPTFVPDLLGTTLNVVIVVQNIEGSRSEIRVALEPPV